MSQKNVWWVDLVKAVVLILVLSVVALSVSSVASTGGNDDESPIKNFNAVGTVGQITSTVLTLTEAQSTVSELGDSFDLNLTSVQKTEDKTHAPIALSTILPGSRVIVQGIKNVDTIKISRVILLSMGTPAPSPATSSTEEVATTTPEEVATTTEEVPATSTPATDEPVVESASAPEPPPAPVVEPDPVEVPAN